MSSKMSLKITAFVFVVLVTCVCNVWCKRSTSRGRGTYWGRSEQGDDASSTYPHNQEHELENAPLHRSADVVKGSAPTAFENRYQTPIRDLEATNRQSLNSPNPQRPTGWKSGSSDQVAKNDWNVASTRFNHPHFQTNKNDADYAYSTTGSYNYYGVGDTYNYGSVHNEGYSHIGTVPPKNALDYILNKSVGPYRYGTLGSGFTKNAYQNVLVGLVTWHFMNTIGKFPHAVYDNRTGNAPNNISIGVDKISKCPDNAELLCEVDATVLCTSDDRLLCVRTQFCGDPTNRCTNKNKLCENGCGDEKIGMISQCVAKATITGNLNMSDLNESLRKSTSRNGEITLCVTTLSLRPLQDIETATIP